MRRGGPRGRGNRPMQTQRPQHQNQRQQNVSGMTGHLQGLKDIDMELELLKRKREIIEQQQEMFSNSYNPRNDYEHSFNQPRDNNYDDYTRLYDDQPRNSYGGGGGGGGGGSSGRKRPHIPVWENEMPIAPKRFSAPNRGVKRSFGSRLGPQINNPRPPRSDFQRLPAPRPAAPKPFKPRAAPPPKRKEFNPTKVTKPSGAAPAIKFAEYKPAQRKKLVTESLSKATVKLGTTKPENKEEILRADVEPSRQMNGRLELALGAIIKQLKQNSPGSEELFVQPAPLRAMKQLVRERIWTVMVGKPITVPELIIANYYDMYRGDSNDDIIMKGLEAQKNTDFVTIYSDDPEVYFRKNLNRLMSLKLEEMTHKLEEIYTNKTHNYRTNAQRKRKNYQTKKPYTVYNAQGEAVAQPFTKRAAPTTEYTPPNKEDAAPNTEDTTPNKEDAAPNTEDAAPNAEDAAPNTEDAAPNAEDAAPNAEDAAPNSEDAAPNTEGALPNTEDMQLKAAEPVSENVPSQTDESESVPEVTFESVGEPDESMKEGDNIEVRMEAATTEKAPDMPQELVTLKQYKAFDKLMNYKILHLIKKYAPMFLKIMDTDGMYRKTKASIITETRKKLLGTSDTPQPSQAALQSTSTSTPQKFLSPLYYVKILGKPGLPKRKAMETFFEQFKPRTIKKHKKIHNLLFVGFVEKESYDNILAADGTVIGRFTLGIKISERNDYKGRINNPDDSTATVEEDKSQLNDSGSDILNTELDGQISDLLDSIRSTQGSSDDVVTDLPVHQSEGNNSQTQGVVVADQENADDVVEVKDNGEVVEIRDSEDDHEVVDIKDVPQAAVEENTENKDVVEPLKAEAKGTPTRASPRLGTPGIRTRRMSKQLP